MSHPSTAILHYSAPPVVGGVESVIRAHVQEFVRAGYPVSLVAGRGDSQALPDGVELLLVPQIDSGYDRVSALNAQLERGNLPENFEELAGLIHDLLLPVVRSFDNLIVHNVFTKHFNLALTVALFRLLEAGEVGRCIAWCHDFTWTSPSSRSKVHPGYPWDLLRTYDDRITYVTVSQQRQTTLAGLFGCSAQDVRVVYNGVDVDSLLGFSESGRHLIDRLGLLNSDLTILMPVRVTRAKNIEYALQVVAELKKQAANPKLIVTGPPDPHDVASMAYFQSLLDQRTELNVESEARFVFESGPDSHVPFTVDERVVGDLYRISDVMFMPSHREGFAMPVLEAGLAGIPVVCTGVPAANEIGGRDVAIFDLQDPPSKTAGLILDVTCRTSPHRLRRRVRQHFTWQTIFERDVKPLIDRQENDVENS